MSTLLFSRDYIYKVAGQLVFLEKEMPETVSVITDNYKSVKDYINDVFLVNLRSYRERYPNQPKFRLEKLKATRQIKPIAVKDDELKDFIKTLNRINYNLDYDCKAKAVMGILCNRFIDHLVDNASLEDSKPYLELRENLMLWDFVLMHDALDAMKHNGFLHSSHYIKDVNFDGPTRSFNKNNKICFGLKRLVGGLRTSYLRNTNNRINEKFAPRNLREFGDRKTSDALIYALKMTTRLRHVVTGKSKDIIEGLYLTLADDFIYNDNLHKA